MVGYVITAAAQGGYFVHPDFHRGMNDGMMLVIEFAGTLEECLSFVREKMVADKAEQVRR